MGQPMELKSSVILIHYIDIIKSPDLFILKIIKEKYSKSFEKYLRMDILNQIPDKDMINIYSARYVRDIFTWLSNGVEFDHEENYKYLYNKWINMIINTPPHSFEKSLDNFISSYLINKIVIYSEEYDKRIDFDIKSMLRDKKYPEKVDYVTGNLDSVIEQYKPDVIFYPYLKEAIDMAREKKIVFAVPDYGFNINDKELIKTIDSEKLPIGLYPIIRNEEEKFLG